MSELFGKAAGVFSILGYVLYIWAIVWKKETNPSRTTWWIWTPLVIILYMSAKESGAGNTLWVARGEVVGILSIALLSLKYGSKEKQKGEGFCILGAVLSLIILWVFNSPAVALGVGLLTDGFALWPTIQKSYTHPEQEDLLAWIMTETANIINLFAISKIRFGEISYPVWLSLLDGIIVYLLLKPLFNSRKERTK